MFQAYPKREGHFHTYPDKEMQVISMTAEQQLNEIIKLLKLINEKLDTTNARLSHIESHQLG
jgi:diadenosine tetraphosphate (Ap4A) HIT family hydrolase